MLAREQVLFSSDAGIAVFVNGAWSTLKKADGSAGTLKLKGAPCCRAAALRTPRALPTSRPRPCDSPGAGTQAVSGTHHTFGEYTGTQMNWEARPAPPRPAPRARQR